MRFRSDVIVLFPKLNMRSYDHVKAIISCRETLFSSLSKKPKLQDLLRTSQRDARSLESHLLLASSNMSRAHGAIQEALSTVTYLTELVKPCKEVGVDISAVVRLASANVLWDQGEMTASIRMLQDLQAPFVSNDQIIEVSKPELLAKLVSVDPIGSLGCHVITESRDIRCQKPG